MTISDLESWARISTSLDKFTRLLRFSCEDVDIYNVDLNDFENHDSEFALTASLLLHNDENMALTRMRR